MTELEEILAQLGTDELRVIATLARRLLEGQRRYGKIDLAQDSRDFRRERAEEIQDLLVYSAFIALREGAWSSRSGVPSASEKDNA